MFGIRIFRAIGRLLKNKLLTLLLLVGIVAYLMSQGLILNKELFDGSYKATLYEYKDDAYQKVEVISVIDGDTFKATVNDKEEKIRLIGINTPELGENPEPLAEEAKDQLKLLIDGKSVYLEKDKSDRDKYDRLLRYVWIEKPTSITREEIKAKMVNSTLVQKGLADIMAIHPNTKYIDQLIEVKFKAQDDNVGIWAEKDGGN